MKKVLKAVVVTGLISAGAFVGGATSHAADFNSQTSLETQGKLTTSGNLLKTIGIDLDTNGQINLALSANNKNSSSTNNQTAVKSKASTKGNLQVNSHGKSASDIVVKTNTMDKKQVSGSSDEKVDWGLILPGGYYVGIDGEMSRLTVKTAANTNHHTDILNNANGDIKSTEAINIENTSQPNSQSLTSVKLKSNIKQNSNLSISDNNKGLSDADGSLQFNLLATFAQAFNLDVK